MSDQLLLEHVLGLTPLPVYYHDSGQLVKELLNIFLILDLSQKNEVARVEFCRRLLDTFGPDTDEDKSPWNRLVSFDFSAPLRREGFGINRQNDRFYSQGPKHKLRDILRIKTGKFSRGYMIAGCISSRYRSSVTIFTFSLKLTYAFQRPGAPR